MGGPPKHHPVKPLTMFGGFSSTGCFRLYCFTRIEAFNAVPSFPQPPIQIQTQPPTDMKEGNT